MAILTKIFDPSPKIIARHYLIRSISTASKTRIWLVQQRLAAHEFTGGLARDFSPLGPRGIAILFVYYGHGEFLHRVNAAISNDGDEGYSLIQEFVCRLQGILSRGPGDLYDPLGLARFALHNKNHLARPCFAQSMTDVQAP